MLRKLQVAVILVCMLSYAEAGTVSIGTASARGEMRVDNYNVKGNATLFDGSTVETGNATASLRLDKGTQITMSTSSRGTLYSDHLVLKQGASELAPSKTFQLQANGLHVVPNQPNSRGVVSVKSANTVEVASLNGSFGVSNDRGIMLANVLPGHSISFAMQAGANTETFSGVGLVTFENGTYYLVTDASVKYVLTCKDSHRFVGDKVVVTGTLQGPAQGGSGATMLCIKSMDINGETGMSAGKKWLIAGIVVGAGAGAGIGLALSNSSSPGASR
jgi:hypothetical protein